jgi:transposase
LTKLYVRGQQRQQLALPIGLSIRTFQRWTQNTGEISDDKRQHLHKNEPHNKQSETERQQILDTCNAPKYADLPTNIIVPMLADKGIYISSKSKFYRVLKPIS